MQTRRKSSAATSTTIPIHLLSNARSQAAQRFRDVFGEHYPRDDGFTYSLENPYVPRAYPRSQRVDYIFASGQATSQDCFVVFDGRDDIALASDHYGMLAVFSFS